MHCFSGEIATTGRFAVVQQQTWIVRCVFKELHVKVQFYNYTIYSGDPNTFNLHISIYAFHQFFSGTIRENILFGLEYNQEQYDRTIEACALDDDFLALTDRDDTYIGEGGANLSGGQMQRVNLGAKVPFYNTYMHMRIKFLHGQL